MSSANGPSINPPSSHEPAAPLTRLKNAALSLQTKVTVLVVLVILLVTTAVTAFFLQQSHRFVREKQEAQLLQSASLLAKAAAPMIANGNTQDLIDLTGRAANGMPLLYVVVTDAEGRELAAASHRPQDAPYGPTHRAHRVAGSRHAPPHIGESGTTPFLDVTYPISQRGSSEAEAASRPVTLLGYVHTGISTNEWRQSLSANLDLVIGVAAIAMLAAVPLGFWLVRRIIVPVESITDTMTQFSKGQFDVRSKVRRRDEIGRLAAAFNQMADQYRKTHDGMVRLNVELEKRVADRTRQLRELAAREPLTGLYNRRHFNEVLQRRFAEAVRYGSELSCIMFDLDGFKTANDVFGHQVGDELLVLTATTIMSQIRTPDLAARYGGDEFIILLPQTDAERAYVLSQRIMEKFAREASRKFPKAAVSMSMGVASLNNLDGADAEGLIRAADQAMYSAKQAGKNRIVPATLVATQPK